MFKDDFLLLDIVSLHCLYFKTVETGNYHYEFRDRILFLFLSNFNSDSRCLCGSFLGWYSYETMFPYRSLSIQRELNCWFFIIDKHSDFILLKMKVCIRISRFVLLISIRNFLSMRQLFQYKIIYFTKRWFTFHSRIWNDKLIMLLDAYLLTATS